MNNTREIRDLLKSIKNTQRAVKEVNKNLNLEDLKKMQAKFEEIKKGQEELIDSFKEYEEEEDNKIEKKEVQKKQEKKEEEIKDENDIRFEKVKEEGINVMKDSILAIIFANEGINLEGLKRIQDQLDNIVKKQEEFEEFFKKYSEEQNEMVEEELNEIENNN